MKKENVEIEKCFTVYETNLFEHLSKMFKKDFLKGWYIDDIFRDKKGDWKVYFKKKF